MEEYDAKIETTGGAVFLAVCRGKVLMRFGTNHFLFYFIIVTFFSVRRPSPDRFSRVSQKTEGVLRACTGYKEKYLRVGFLYRIEFAR